MPKYISGRVKRTPQGSLTTDRYRYLEISQAEPNLGDPKITDTESALPVGQQYQIISIIGYPGERYWIPRGGGLIPGSISIYDEGFLTPPGGVSSITQLNFVGAAISAKGYLNPDNSPGIGVTITVFSPGNNKELLFNSSNEFGTSSNLTFDYNTNLLSILGNLNVGIGGSILTTKDDKVGIGTTNPTQKLHLQGDLRLTGTVYDYLNNPGNVEDILIKNNLGGLIWINQTQLRSGAGGTYQNVQFHDSAQKIGGAPTFVYNEITKRVGIGSTIPTATLDVIGTIKLTGQTEIDYLKVGVTTSSSLNVSGLTTTQNLIVSGVSTLGFITGTSAFFTGIVTATKLVGFADLTDLNVSGVATIGTLKVSGLTTTRNLQVIGITTLGITSISSLYVSGLSTFVGYSTFNNSISVANNLNVSGITTVGNIKINQNTISTNLSNLILDSLGGTTQINDTIYVNDTTNAVDFNTGSIRTDGGVGIELDLYVGGKTSLAVNGGITTTGGDLYVGGDLYIKDDIILDEINGRIGRFTEFLKTKDFQATGISSLESTTIIGGGASTGNASTILQVVGVNSSVYIAGNIGLGTTIPQHKLHVIGSSRITGFSTFDSTVDINGGAYIDNIQIGITNDNTIDTTSGNLTIDSVGGNTTVDDNVFITGITSITNTTDSSSKITGALKVAGGVGIEKNLNVGSNVTIGSTTDSTNKDTGALIVEGGVGIEKNLNVGNNLYVGSTTDSTNKDTGALIVDGGVGIEKNLNVGGASSISGITTFGSNVVPFNDGTQDFGASNKQWNTIYAKTVQLTDVVTQESIRTKNLNVTGIATIATLGVTGLTTSKDIRVIGVSTLGNVKIDTNTITTSSGNLTLDANGGTVTVSAITDSTATNIGALVVSGGIGIAKNLYVGGNSVFNGNITLGDGTADKLKINASIASTIAVDVNEIYDLGTADNLRWNRIYAKEFKGQFIGNADTATKLSAQKSFSISNDVIAPAVNFDGSQNVELVATLKSQGITPNVYGNSTSIPVLGINTAGIITSVTTASVVNIPGNAATATRLITPRNIDIDGDVIGVGIGTTFDGSRDVTIQTTLKSQGITPNIYGNANTVPVLGINTAGIITSVTTASVVNIPGNAETATRLATPRNIDIDGDVIGVGIGTTFDGSRNVVIQTTLKSQGITPNVYGNSTSIPVLGINTAGIITSVTTASVVNIPGNAETATRLATPRNIDIDGDVIGVGIGTTFDGSRNVTIQTTLKSQGITPNVYGNSTSIPVLGINTAGIITSVTTSSVVNIPGNAATATYADNAGIATYIKGGNKGNVLYQTGPSSTGFASTDQNNAILTYDATLGIPVWKKSDTIVIGTATVANDLTIIGNNQLLYQKAANDTRVLESAGSPGQILMSRGSSAEPVWTSTVPTTVVVGLASDLNKTGTGQLLYQSGTNQTSLLGFGISGYVLVAKGNNAIPVWEEFKGSDIKTTNGTTIDTINNNLTNGTVTTSTGTTIDTINTNTNNNTTNITNLTTTVNGKIDGIGIYEENTKLGIATDIKFVGAGVTATYDGTSKLATVTITSITNVTVTQTGYSGTNPITVSGGSAIAISSTSNAYGTRWVSTASPTTEGNNGDIWYQIT